MLKNRDVCFLCLASTVTTYPQLHINSERAGDVPWLIPQGEDTGSDFALNSHCLLQVELAMLSLSGGV